LNINEATNINTEKVSKKTSNATTQTDRSTDFKNFAAPEQKKQNDGFVVR
jgi:hypothetical protein